MAEETAVVTVKKPKPIKREIELDFIRGIAILMVIDFHSPERFFLYPMQMLGFQNLGWAGVNIFFVLSGFLVGGLLIKEWLLKGTIDRGQFLIRRGFKIWPQYYVFILLQLATRHRTLHSLWGNLLNIQNYVGGVAHTWTLAVEEHAYILLVLFLGFAARRKLSPRRVFVSLAVCIVVSWILTLVEAMNHMNPFSHTETRIGGILYGVLLAILYHYVPPVFFKIQRYWPVLIAILLLALLYLRLGSTSLLGEAIGPLVTDSGAVAVLLLLYRRREGVKRIWVYRLVAWIGVYSYGIYLWHVSTMVYSAAVTPHLPGWLQGSWTRIGPILFSIAIGYVFTKLVEFPALKLRERLVPRRVDSAVGIPAEIEATTEVPETA